MSGTPAVDTLLPSWDHIETRFVDDGIPGIVVVRDHPRVALFIDPAARALGAYFETSDPPAVAPLATVRSRETEFDGRRVLEVSTADRALFRTFYLLIGDVVERVVKDRRPVGRAISEALANWRALLQQAGALSDEHQAGLCGELWLLQRLIRLGGPSAITGWTGPTGAAHDFRLAGGDLEVKTTFRERRTHVVNGLAQLTAVEGVPLYLVSLRLQTGGEEGRSLPDQVAAIENLLSNGHELEHFRHALERLGYRAEDARLYPTRRRLADAAMLVPVDDGCPRLTRSALSTLPETFAAARITRVDYRIDVEGLGWPETSEAFRAVLPSPVPSEESS